MQDELAAIDVGPLEELMRIKGELDTLEGRLAAMEERKESVAAPVYVRVRNDYEARRRSLEGEAAPLKRAAREQYAKLAALLQRSEADHESARLDREEIEFRHALGEFDKAEFKRRLGEIDERLAQKAAAREQAQGLRERFVAAFRSEEELEADAPAPPAKASGGSKEPAPPPADAETRRLKPIDPAALEVPKVEVPTVVVKPTAASTVVAPAPADTPAPGGKQAAVGATQLLRAIKPADLGTTAKLGEPVAPTRSGRLVPQNAEAGKLSHTIGGKPLVIGSTTSCDIRVTGASEKHAELRSSPAGFSISDLGGGVRVNGVVVEQHLLHHDDVVEIGAARFVFREA